MGRLVTGLMSLYLGWTPAMLPSPPPFLLCLTNRYQALSNVGVGLPWWLSSKEATCQCRRHGFNSWARKIPLEKEMATHHSILAWEIPWTKEPGGLQSMGPQSQTQLGV